MRCVLFFPLFFLFGISSLVADAQRLHVTGQVTDNTSLQPVSQIAVVEKISGTVTITSDQGIYSLLLNRGEVEMVFTGLNYEPAHFSFVLKGDTVIDVKLTTSLNERNKRSRKEIGVVFNQEINRAKEKNE